MAATKHTPEYKKIEYNLNESGYYQMKEQPLHFFKMPLKFKVEETQRKEIVKSNHIIRGRQVKGKYTFFTGLLPTQFNSWYFGDYFEKKNGIKKNSFVLFKFSPNKHHLTVCFFNHYKLYPNKRESFIDRFVRWFESKKGSEYPTPILSNQLTATSMIQR